MEKNQLKSGVILSYGNILIGNIISIAYTPIMLRLLGQNEYGLYQLVASVVSYLGLFNFGFGSTYIRFHSERRVKKEEEKIAVLNGMFLSIFLILGLIALVTGVILTGYTGSIFAQSLTSGEIETAKVLMLLMVLNIALSFPISVFDCYIMAYEQFFFQRILTLTQTILNPFLALPLLLMGYHSVALVVVTTFLTVMKLIFNMWFCIHKHHMRFIFRGFELKKIKEIWIFSSYIFINMIVDQINWSVDKFLLGKMLGTVSVAIYAVAANLNVYYMNFSTSISSVFIPRVNYLVASGKEDQELTKLFTKVGRIQFYVLS
ncbi:MAG: oligosaccharide flippase family protein, partial [Lachnoclostridium sp.]|nr:oligosaccharide flippase family protein [Lachnoclostridium sp.]